MSAIITYSMQKYFSWILNILYLSITIKNHIGHFSILAYKVKFAHQIPLIYFVYTYIITDLNNSGVIHDFDVETH